LYAAKCPIFIIINAVSLNLALCSTNIYSLLPCLTIKIWCFVATIIIKLLILRESTSCKVRDINEQLNVILCKFENENCWLPIITCNTGVRRGACAHVRQYAIVYYCYYNSVLLQPHDTTFILTIKLKMFIDRIYYYTTVTCIYIIYFIKIDNEIY